MVRFAGIGTGGDNVPIVGEKPQLSPSYFLNIIPCLAGCITGGAVCHYLTNKRKQETLEAIFKLHDEGKKFKVVKVRQKEDQNNDREEYDELEEGDKQDFNSHRDIYGSSFSGWWNYLWKKQPIYRIIEDQEELDKKPINDQIIKNPVNQKLIQIDNHYDINYTSNKKKFNKDLLQVNNGNEFYPSNKKKQYDELSTMYPDDHAISYTSTNLPVLSAEELAELIKNKKNNIDNDVIFAFFERIKGLKDEEMKNLLDDNRSGNIFNFILKIFNKAGVEQIPQKLRIVILKKIIANPEVFFFPDKEQEDGEDINNNKKDDIDNSHEDEINEARVSIFLKLLPYCVEDINFENLDDNDKNALNKLFFVMVKLFNKGKIDLNNDNGINYQNEQSLFLFFSKLLQRYVDRADELPKFDGYDADNDEQKFYENLLLLTIRCYSKKQKLPAIDERDEENFHHFVDLILSKVKDFSFLQKEQRDKLFILIFKTYKEEEKLPSLKDDEEEEKKEEEREGTEGKIEERRILKKPNKKRDEWFIQLFKEYIKNGCLPDEFWQILKDILISFIEHKRPIPKGFMTMLSAIFDKNIECKFSKEFWDLFIEHIEKNIHQIPDDWKKIKTKIETQTVNEGVQKDDEGIQGKERQLEKTNVDKIVIKQPDESKDKKNHYTKNLFIDKNSKSRFTYKSTVGGKKGRGSKSTFSNLGSGLVPTEQKNTLFKQLDGYSNIQTLEVKDKDNRFINDVKGFRNYNVIGVKKNLDMNNKFSINKQQCDKYELAFSNEDLRKQNEVLNAKNIIRDTRKTFLYYRYRDQPCDDKSAIYFKKLYGNDKEK